MEPSSWTLISQPKGRLFKSEFCAVGLQTQVIFSEHIWQITTCVELCVTAQFQVSLCHTMQELWNPLDRIEFLKTNKQFISVNSHNPKTIRCQNYLQKNNDTFYMKPFKQ